MRFERSFTAPAQPAGVLAALTDVERIAAVLPGGLVDGRSRGERFGGQFALQLGSATAPYSAIVEVAEHDAAAGRAVVTVRANDDQGDGTADVRATFQVTAADVGSSVAAVVEVTLGGRLTDVPEGDSIAESYARNAIAQLRAGIVAGGDAVPEPAPRAAEPEPAAPAAPEAPVAGEPAPSVAERAAARTQAYEPAAPPPPSAPDVPEDDDMPPTRAYRPFEAPGPGVGEPAAPVETPAAGPGEPPAPVETPASGPGEPPAPVEPPAPAEASAPSPVEPPAPAETPASRAPEPPPRADEPALHAPPPPEDVPAVPADADEPAPEPASPAAPAGPRTTSVGPPGYDERRVTPPSPGRTGGAKRGSGGLLARLRGLLKRG